MTIVETPPYEAGQYRPGLDWVREAVVSSHFMEKFVGDQSLQLYSDAEFDECCLMIQAHEVDDKLIPSLIKACDGYSAARAQAAEERARLHYRKYRLARPEDVGLAQYMTEVMFDRQFLKAPRTNCSRWDQCQKIARCIEQRAPIELLIPALPYKFSCPLKTRGRLPDLAEVNFILGLYETVSSIDLLYRRGVPNLPRPSATFVVVSDGKRFSHIVSEPERDIELYQHYLARWISRLGLEAYISVVDYRALLRERLCASVEARKNELRAHASLQYATVLGPIFSPNAMSRTLRMATELEPDPETSNPEGRFVPLLRSLVYTVNYRSLAPLRELASVQFMALYRELTGHIFEPYVILSKRELGRIEARVRDELVVESDDTETKEYLRQAMLVEVWDATIEYLAEIKSDRELEEDPIQASLPNHVRWTIHPKKGQLALLSPTASGTSVQAWAGAPVFKRTTTNNIKLCTLPVLALEGEGAIPVRVQGAQWANALGNQPLFYIHRDVGVKNLGDFFAVLTRSLTRRRSS
jgi:hypothetical protein